MSANALGFRIGSKTEYPICICIWLKQHLLQIEADRFENCLLGLAAHCRSFSKLWLTTCRQLDYGIDVCRQRPAK